LAVAYSSETKRHRPRERRETSTESEWVARHLEGLGHEVVADTNFAAMYATRSRRVKTDKRDARTLAEACKLGAYRPAHRTFDRRRHTRAVLAVREVMVRVLVQIADTESMTTPPHMFDLALVQIRRLTDNQPHASIPLNPLSGSPL
jgi:transposase